MAQRASDLGRKLIALVILLLAGFVLLKFVIGAVAAVAGFIIAVIAVIAIVWALRVL
jgi:hypothetical protein